MTSLLSSRFSSVQRAGWTRAPLRCLPTPGIGSANPWLGKDCASQWLERISVGRSQAWEPKKQTLTLTYMAVVSYRHLANKPSQISHIPLWGAATMLYSTAQASTIRRLPDRSWRCCRNYGMLTQEEARAPQVSRRYPTPANDYQWGWKYFNILAIGDSQAGVYPLNVSSTLFRMLSFLCIARQTKMPARE